MVKRFDKNNTGRRNTRGRSKDEEQDSRGRSSNSKKINLNSKRFSRRVSDTNLESPIKRIKKAESNQLSSEMRLNRFIAHSGVCSRREADKYITTGLVTVNGKVVKELGTKVQSTDDIRFDGKRLNPESKIYILLNKPKGFVTTTDDSQGEKTALSLIKNAIPERVYPVGRLDKGSTGLILFTNDGDLSKRLTNPKHKTRKVYQVGLDKPLTKNDFEKIAEGVELEDGFIKPIEIQFINPQDKSELGIEFISGRSQLVRRMFEQFGYKVKKLDRVLFAGLTKKNLPRGKWRVLDDKELNFLKMK